MLNRLQGPRAARIDASGMVPTHASAFERLSKARDEIYLMRGVNPDTRRLLEQDFSTKGMNIKGKSSDWGPHAALIPVDQKFSKLGNPRLQIDEKQAAKIVEFHGKLEKCLQKGECLKTDAVMPDGTRIMVVENPNLGQEMPVTLKDGGYFDFEGNPIELAPEVQPRPMEVVAVRNDSGELVPVTADYDLLAFGFQGEGSRSMGFHETLGNIGERETEALNQLNAAGSLAGYKGGKLSHHGAENVNPFTPGALGLGPNDDKLVTALDPQLGVVSIPVCDAKCMQQWCDSTRACGGLKVCGDSPRPPCIPLDPDRLLKDYFHERRLAGYNLTPNSRWHWGDYNPLGGWTVQGFLRKGISGQLTIAERQLVRPAIYETAKQAIIEGVKKGGSYLFACAKDPKRPMR
ncbi:MAG: hypothetical protein KDI68_08975 [Gammaproteobacteria bacterium]|nr:hypothetical protein [Gammaproteobacteria bacterium]